MPLKLDFKAGDKLVINGAVVENIGHNAKLLIHNESAILREKEILTEAETATPAARVYFSLQCAYMFPKKEEDYLKIFRQFLDDYVKAAPSAAPIGEEITEQVEAGYVYRGLRATQKLIQHEAETFSDLRDRLKELQEKQAEVEAQKASG